MPDTRTDTQTVGVAYAGCYRRLNVIDVLVLRCIAGLQVQQNNYERNWDLYLSSSTAYLHKVKHIIRNVHACVNTRRLIQGEIYYTFYINICLHNNIWNYLCIYSHIYIYTWKNQQLSIICSLSYRAYILYVYYYYACIHAVYRIMYMSKV